MTTILAGQLGPVVPDALQAFGLSSDDVYLGEGSPTTLLYIFDGHAAGPQLELAKTDGLKRLVFVTP